MLYNSSELVPRSTVNNKNNTFNPYDKHSDTMGPIVPEDILSVPVNEIIGLGCISIIIVAQLLFWRYWLTTPITAWAAAGHFFTWVIVHWYLDALPNNC